MTKSNDDFSVWASLFLRAQAEEAPAPMKTPAAKYDGITPAARDLLLSIDAGGVPAFVTGNLKQIAEDNGIAVGGHWTPNDIVEALRGKTHPETGSSGDERDA